MKKNTLVGLLNVFELEFYLFIHSYRRGREKKKQKKKKEEAFKLTHCEK